MLLGYRADGLPFLLQLHQRVGRSFPVGAVLQGFRLFAEGAFLLEVLVHVFLYRLEELGFLVEEGVAGGAEAFEDLYVHLLWRVAYGLPLVLQGDDLLCLGIPGGEVGQFVVVDTLDDFADHRLLVEVLLLGLLQGVEVLLVAAVDGGRCGLEACPYLFAQLFGHGACLAEFLMELLQLVEGRHDVCLLGQLLGGFAEVGLYLEVLLEVIFAELIVQLQQVVELLHVELVVLPQLVDAGLRHELHLVPLLLEALELRVVLVGVFGRLQQVFQLFDDGEFHLQVHFLLFLHLGGQFVPFVLDDGHCVFHFLLQGVGCGHVVFGCSSCFGKLLACCFLFGVVQLVECLLQAVYFGFGDAFHVACDLFQPCDDFFLRQLLCRSGFYCAFHCLFLSRSFCRCRFRNLNCFLFFF